MLPIICIMMSWASSNELWKWWRDRRLDVDVKYYADGENGIKMEQDLVVLAKELGLKVDIEAPANKNAEKSSKKRVSA